MIDSSVRGQARVQNIGHAWDLIVVNTIWIVEILFSSRINRILDPVAQPLLLGTILAVVCAYSAVAILQLRIASLLILSFILATILGGLARSSALAGSEFNINAALQLFTITLFIAFVVLIRRGETQPILRILVAHVTTYATLYVLVAAAHWLAPIAALEPLVLFDLERGDRLFLHPAAASFAWFYWLTRSLTRPSVRAILFALVSSAAIALSLSRGFIAVTAIITVMAVARFRAASFRRVSLCAVCFAALYLTFGFVDAGFNPFSVFGDDSSAQSRVEEYEVAREFLTAHPFGGAGIAANAEDVETIAGTKFFFASDLGIIGVWWDFGLPGLAALIIACGLCTRWPAELTSEFRMPVFLSGNSLAMQASVAPTIFYPGGAGFFALLLALALTAHWTRRHRARHAASG